MINIGVVNERVRVDLHMHTTSSDGTWSVDELIEKLIENSIKLFSISDHDTVENTKRVAELVKEKGLYFIPGVEVNSTFEGRNYHILGYGIDTENQTLLKLLSYNRQQLEKVDCECIEYLQKKGFKVSASDYESYTNNPKRGGWKALNYLVDNRLCAGHKDFFDLFESDGGPFEKLSFKHSEEVIDTILNAGGIPIIAHPGARFYSRDYKYIISKMHNYGIGGIECFHPENNKDIIQYCLKFCMDNNLCITGGSDCHGDFLTNRKMGQPEIFLDMLNLGDLFINASK